jgi:hypothetical protein
MDDAPLADPPVTPEGKANTRLPSRFILHVDGAGSFLILRERCITVGAEGSSRTPDLGLLADTRLPTTTIERTDEDYFLVSEAPVRVNGAPVTRKLLGNGDRIALSNRCRLRFTVPNAASTSAVLELSGTRLPHSDARRVILFEKSLVLGPGSSAHVRVDDLAEPVVLHMRDGQLFCRTPDEVRVDDQLIDRHAGIPLGASVRVGPLSMVVAQA